MVVNLSSLTSSNQKNLQVSGEDARVYRDELEVWE